MQTNAAGQAVLKLKTPWRDGTTNLVMSPLEFMQRLAALVPRPRLHLIRFHGVLARATASRRPIHDAECRQRVLCWPTRTAGDRSPRSCGWTAALPTLAGNHLRHQPPLTTHSVCTSEPRLHACRRSFIAARLTQAWLTAGQPEVMPTEIAAAPNINHNKALILV